MDLSTKFARSLAKIKIQYMKIFYRDLNKVFQKDRSITFIFMWLLLEDIGMISIISGGICWGQNP